MEISPVVQEFDRFMRDVMDTLNYVPIIVNAFKDTLVDCQNWKKNKNRVLVVERDFLVEMLKDARNEVTELENQMRIVRRLVDEEKYRRKCAERDRDYYRSKVEKMNMTLNIHSNKFSMNSEKFSNSKKYHKSSDKYEDKLNNATDLQTTGSIISDLSYTRDENDFDFSFHEDRSRREASNMVKLRKRRSSSAVRFSELSSKDKVLPDFLPTATPEGDPTEMLDINSNIRAVPRSFLQNENYISAVSVEYDVKTPTTPEHNKQFLNVNIIHSRSHNFQQKTMLKGGMCSVCFKRLRFSTMGYKCRDCKTICHAFCKDNAPLPCLFNGNTPSKISSGLISDYTPTFSPMVPSLVIQCIKEIEERGLTREGLYLIPGSEADVKCLKTKFLRGKGVPDLTQIQDIDVICGCLKDFFKSLKDPLATRARWEDFALAVEVTDAQKMKKMLYQIISELPQPNRETMAYLALHLKTIVESPCCKMTVSLLANVFGPIIIGYSCDEPKNFYRETRIVNKVMVELIELPKDYWEGFLCKNDPKVAYSPMNEFVIPSVKLRRKYFETP